MLLRCMYAIVGYVSILVIIIVLIMINCFLCHLFFYLCNANISSRPEGNDPKETFGIGLLRFERYDTFVQSCCTCHGHKSHVITIVTCGLPHLQPKTGIKSCGCFTKIIISCCPRYQRCIQGSRHVRTMIERTNLDVRTKF